MSSGKRKGKNKKDGEEEEEDEKQTKMDETVYELLVNQLNLVEFSKALGEQKMNSRGKFLAARKSLIQVLRRDYSDIHMEARNEELEALYQMIQDFGPRLVSLEVISSFFENQSVNFPFINEHMLKLAEYGRQLLRATYDVKDYFTTKSTPLRRIVQMESARDHKYIRALCRWITRLFPFYPPYSFHGKEHNELTGPEKNYIKWRNGKDKIVIALRFWSDMLIPFQSEFVHWLLCIHLESLCVATPLLALGILDSFQVVCENLPPIIPQVFSAALIEAVEHEQPFQVLHAIFPEYCKREDRDPQHFYDDPIRDVMIFSLGQAKKQEKGTTDFQRIASLLARQDIHQRAFLFSCGPDPPFRFEEHRFLDNLDPNFKNPYRRTQIHDIMFAVMDKVTSQKKGLGLVGSFLQGKQHTLSDILSLGSHPEVFCIFVYWLNLHREISKSSQQPDQLPEFLAFTPNDFGRIFYKQLPDLIMKAFMDFALELDKRTVTVSDLKSCTATNLVHLPLQTISGLKESQLLTDGLEQLLKRDFGRLSNMSKICDQFIPDDPVGPLIKDVIQKWNSWRIIDLSYFFREVEEVPPAEKSPPGPLPAIIIESMAWFLEVRNSSLFLRIWGENQESLDLTKFSSVRRDWEAVLVSLIKQSVSFVRIEELLQYFLGDQNDLNLLYSTCSITPEGDGGQDVKSQWVVRKPNPDFYSKTTDLLTKFFHLRETSLNLEKIEGGLLRICNWIKDTESVIELQQHLRELQSLLESNKWDNQILLDYSKFAPSVEKIHPSLLNLPPEMYDKMMESMDLFEWLRSQSDDQDFTRGIEMAMGRSEMECPPELWVQEEGQAGRVNERILSMLQSVRGYLHTFIFREALVYPNTKAFVEQFLAKIRPFNQVLLSQIDTSNEYRLPLIELLSSSGDSAAPDRLLRMLQPSSCSRWVCDSSGMNPSEISQSESILRLDYLPPSKKDRAVRHLTVHEVEDFQSSVVLARTDQRGEDTRQKIANFVQSFGWMRQYASTLLTLHSLGHFDYDSFFDETPMETDFEEIRQKALNAQKTLADWEKVVQETRLKYPALNHFGMKMVWEMAKQLKTRSSAGFASSQSRLFREMIYLVNPEAVVDSGLVCQIEQDLVSSWTSIATDIIEKEKEEEGEVTDMRQGVGGGDEEEEETSRSQKKLSLLETLKSCGEVVQSVFGKLNPLHRPVSVPEGTIHLSLSEGEVRLISSRTYESVFLEALSAFMQAGVLPERRTLLLCREHSTWEDLQLLLLRWKQATIKSGEKLFAIVHPDLLENDVQVKVVSFIQEVSDSASVPLLLVCGPSRSVYVVSQLLNRRTPSYPLSRSVTAAILDHCFSSRVRTFASKSAGAGKSFQIRKGMFYEDEKYMHVPATAISQHLHTLGTHLSPYVTNTLDEASSNKDPVLHIDIYDTVGADLNSYLFELIFFSGYCNFAQGKIFFYPPSRTYLSIELPAGSLSKHMIVAKLCPIVTVRAEPDLFAITKKELLQGMGPAAFHGRRYDGTALRKREEGVRHANAHERLQYVCTALNLVKTNGGKFPHVFETHVAEPEALLESLRFSASLGASIAPEDISGGDCFDLLVEASGIGVEQVSLWCLWNFVNMVYWQLRDMHYPDSPLSAICMPVEGAEKGENQDEKELMKGELLAFILRTAREFATRQSNLVSPEEIIGLEVTGFNRYEFNGTWKKQAYKHDGKDVFGSAGYRGVSFLLYYRAADELWVIDDVIAQEGSCYSHTVLPDYNTVWKTSASWQEWPQVRVLNTRNVEGFQSSALQISGFPSDDENGLYLRQPPYDNINDKPHYIKMVGERRHLFYSTREGQWQICPVCTDDEGAFGICNGQPTMGKWSVIPDDIVEKHVQITVITAGDKEEDASFIKKAEVDIVPDFVVDDDEAEELMNKKEEDFQEFLALERLFETTKRWADSNHECLLFSNKNHVISFLSMSPDKMRKNMQPNLLQFLEQNRINVGESLNELSSRHHQVLGALTEVYRKASAAKKVMDGTYCLTGDNLLKMLAIFIRLRVGIPVILMGECGCGKTALLKYLCAWLDVDLIVLDVHGGTTPEDISATFEKADHILQEKKKPVYVFLDEVNACSHMGLISEVITKRSLDGIPIHDQIHILAALNPYRRRPPQSETFGLVYKHKKGGHSPMVHDEMATLVYRVTPIPTSLRDFVFDFGSLVVKQERMYVESMIKDSIKLPSLEGLEHGEAQKEKKRREIDYEILTSLVIEAQTFVRNKEGDPSAVSLRDVKRFLHFVNFFLGMKAYSKTTLVSSVVVSLALVYFYRLSREDYRTTFWAVVCDIQNDLSRLARNSSFTMPPKAAKTCKRYSEFFSAVLQKTQTGFCKNLDVEDGIALNNALKENLFVTVVCILNRVPVFLVGKPGTSKTLTLQILASNLQGEQSPNKMWRKYPSVYVFPYQCSPMSDSQSIQHQFNMAVRYQEHANNTITVLLLDEVGLAEHSPDMPLKCLHGMLVDPPIAIVGLSNWVLDPAKMNRAVLVQRPEPSKKDIAATGVSIMGLPPQSEGYPIYDKLSKISQAYFYVYTHQKGRDFIGMRDYYSLVKYLKSQLPRSVEECKKMSVSLQQLIFSLCRNFGGRADILRDMIQAVCENLFPEKAKRLKEEADAAQREAEEKKGEEEEEEEEEEKGKKKGNKGQSKKGNSKREKGKKPYAKKDDSWKDSWKEAKEEILREMTMKELQKSYCFKMPPLRELIQTNLKSTSARHIMLLTKNSSALPLLFFQKLVDRENTKVIIGSEFSEDDTELYLVQQMNEVKLAMATGKTIVLMNADNMYEALYDVLNQRYLIKKDPETGKVQRLLRLAIGSRSSLCHVEDTFRIIVIAEQDYAYRELDLPLLNRFEKQILTPYEVLGTSLRLLVERLDQWTAQILKETRFQSLQKVFCGFHYGTIPSAVLLKATQLNKEGHFGNLSKDERNELIMEEVKMMLKCIAGPAAIALSPSLQSLACDSYFSDFPACVDNLLQTKSTGTRASLIMTQSPVTALTDSQISSLEGEVELVRLDEVKSERSFSLVLERFFNKLQQGGSKLENNQILIVQFDPIMCSPLQINHAKFLCTNALLKHERFCLFSGPPKVKSLVIFLVHMPPGVRSRDRAFVLDFENPWECRFVDDMPGMLLSNGNPVSVPQILHTPLIDLFELGFGDLSNLVTMQLSAALCRVRQPSPLASTPLRLGGEELRESEEKHELEHEKLLDFAHRLNLTKNCLDEPRFRSLFLSAVNTILRLQGGEEGKRSGLFLHTYLAVGDLSCGTLLQSLNRTMNEMVLQAVVHVLYFFEKNFNFSTVEAHKELWLALATNTSVFDPASQFLVAKLGGKAVFKDMQMRVASNIGKFGTFVSSFPFSYAIFDLLNGDETRKAIEVALQQGVKRGSRFEMELEFMSKVFNSFFGDQIAALIHEKLNEKGNQKLDYLHDFVSICALPVIGLSFEEVKFVYQTVLSSYHPRALESPAAIHTTFRHNDVRIQILCSILAVIPQQSRRNVYLAMREASTGKAESLRLLELLETVFRAVVNLVWDKATNLPFVTLPEGLPAPNVGDSLVVPNFVASVHPDVTALLNDWAVYHEEVKGKKIAPQGEAGLSPKAQWDAILLLKIFLEGFLLSGESWGMGKPAFALLNLIRSSNILSLTFFEKFCVCLTELYSGLRCCLCCGKVMGHQLEEAKSEEQECARCRSIKITNKPQYVASSVGQFQNIRFFVGSDFWNDFFSTPADRKRGVASKSSALQAFLSESKEQKPQPSRAPAPSSSSRGKNRKKSKQQLEHEKARLEKERLAKEKNSKKAGKSGKEEEAPQEETLIGKKKRLLRESKLAVRGCLEALIVRYVGEILLFVGINQQEFDNVERRLINHVSQMVNSPDSRLVTARCKVSETRKDLLIFPFQSSTRLALMNILLRAERDLGRDVGGFEEEDDDEENTSGQKLFRITTLLGEKLYLLNRLSEQQEKLVGMEVEGFVPLRALTEMIRENDLEDILALEDSSKKARPKKRERTETLARVQVVLRRYGELIGSDLFPDEEMEKTEEYVAFVNFFNKFLKQDKADNLRVYVLKSVRAVSEIDGLLKLLFMGQQKGVHWIKYDQEALSIFSDEVPTGPMVPAEYRDQGFKLEDQIILLLQKEPENHGRLIDGLFYSPTMHLAIVGAFYDAVVLQSISQKRKTKVFFEAVTNAAASIAERFSQLRKPLCGSIMKFAAVLTLSLTFPDFKSPLSAIDMPVPAGDPEKTRAYKLICLRILGLIMAHPNSWLARLFTHPNEFQNYFLPASKFDSPLAGLRWYECPNGHPYSVGECGMPMQKGKCPSCGEVIGGEHHTSVSGVRDAKKNPMMDLATHMGYQYVMHDYIYRVNPTTIHFIRFIVELTLYLSHKVLLRSHQVSKLVSVADERLDFFFTKNIGYYFNEFQRYGRLDTSLVGLMLNAMTLRICCIKEVFPNAKELESKAVLSPLENRTNQEVQHVRNDVVNSIKNCLDSSFQAANRQKSLQRAIGMPVWEALNEEIQTQEQQKWKFSSAPTVESFTRKTGENAIFGNQYPLLQAFLEEEAHLQKVRCIIPILEWHRVIFSAFQSNEINREDARSITNEMAVERLATEEERVRGRRVLKDFCAAFNASFPLVQNLYECQRNPFLTDDGQVALNGNKTHSPMSPDTIVAFSIPSMIPGENDATGLCTVQLLHRLHRIHEDALGIGAERQGRRPEGPAAARRENKEIILPEISCDTPARVLRQKLVMYNRRTDFLPLLNTYSHQQLLGDSSATEFSYNKIEDSLRVGVFGGKQSTRLHIRYYQYQGDVRSSGRVSGLKNRVPQSKLNDSILQMVCSEVDTQHKIVRLLSSLEIVVNFLTSVGGQKVKGQMGIGETLLRDYALDTLQMDEGEWDEVSTPTLNEHVRLCHLQCLFLRLEEMMTGSPLDDVKEEYREPMGSNEKGEIQSLLENNLDFFAKIMYPALRDFLVQRATGKAGIVMEPDLPLKDLVEYHISDEDYDQYDAIFPDSFLLKYAFSLYELLGEFQ